ncbi:MAG TPA: tetratricopeptide repeat protein [Thermoanaerobaculia bacterium]|nr:tetratricopeptide repeat protein [Thermoanaerobaculia bacterium]
MADRFSRKEIKHDKFVEEMETAYAVARRNAPIILWSIVGILVLIAAAVGYSLHQAQREKLAQERLAEAIRILEAPLAQEGETAPAAGTYRSEEEKLAQAEPILRDLVEEYAGRDAADVANLYLARIEVERGDLDSARARYEAFIDDHPDHVLGQGAKVSLSDLRIALGEAAAVAADLEQEIASRESSLPQDVALAVLARAYEAADQPAKAREAYQRIVNEFPDSPYTLEAQRKLFRG